MNGAPNKNHNYYAFTHAKIVVDWQTTVNDGTLLVRDGVIVEAGEKVTVPQGAVVRDLKGKTIYPSLIDVYSTYGMPEIKRNDRPRFGPQMESSAKGAYGWNQAIRPETDASKVFSADPKTADELRKMGFGTVNAFVRDGIARGSSCVVALGDSRENEMMIASKAAAMYSFDKGTSTQDYPSSLMGAIALLRQTYLDAQWYLGDVQRTSSQNAGRKEYNISLEAWNNLQSLPQIFEVNDKLSALRADKMGDEFKQQYIIKGSGNEYQRLDELKNTFAKFIIPLNFPAPYDVEDPYDAMNVSLTEMKHWEMAPANPALLAQKYIPFAITCNDLKDKKDFWKNLRKAIQYGLSEKTALRALTAIPAEMLRLQDKIGALKKGMLASFIITSGDLFDEKDVIYENWVMGNPFVVNDLNAPDIRANYDLKAGDRSFTLKITGDMEALKASISSANDTLKTPVNISASGNTVSISFKTKKDTGYTRLGGNIWENLPTGQAGPLRLAGRGQFSSGEWFDWSATYSSASTPEAKKDTAKKSPPKIGEIIYPFCAYGTSTRDSSALQKYFNRWDAVLIKNITVWTNEPDGILKNRDVLITEGKIVRIADNIEVPKTVKAKVIDGTGRHLTPGIIDEHSHIAISNGVNEGTQASSAEVRIGDVINSEDINIYRNLAGGVVAAQLLHGSANPIGGQSGLIKMRWGKAPEDMKIKGADGFIKFALGENVKQSNWGDFNTIRFPQTRMGVEQVYADYFTRAKEYEAKWKAYNEAAAKSKIQLSPPRKDLELEAIDEILNKKKFITCHSYVQSEINMLMKLGDSLGFRVNTFTHILEGYKVADKMKARGIGGSTFADWWAYKMEVMEAIPYNAALLEKMGVVTAVNSDDAEMARRLNQEAGKAIKYGGLSEEEALKLCTLNPAKLLHLDDKMGSIKVGKSGDVVVWSDNPLSIYAKALYTLVDGQVYFDSEKDQQLREDIKKERARIIQKMIDEKKGGAPTQKPSVRTPKLYHCDDLSTDYMNE